MEAILQVCESQPADAPIDLILLIASQLKGESTEATIKRLAKAGVKHLLVTGDALTPKLKALCEQYEIYLWNCYGPTECTFGLSMMFVNGLPMHKDSYGNLVAPIAIPNHPQIKTKIINGVLHIISPFLGEYLSLEHNQKNFCEIDGARAFNTGDIMAEQNGYLYYLGSEEFCNVAGVKVYTPSIENYILRYNDQIDEKLQAAVILKKHQDDVCLVAYIVIPKDFDRAKFKAYLKKGLRNEELPIIFEIDVLPMVSHNQKIDVDRKFLMSCDDQSRQLLFDAPLEQSEIMDERHQIIKNIWCKILGRKDIGLDVEFQLAGGTSLKALAMVNEIKKQLCSGYSYQNVLQLDSVTINTLASNLDKPLTKQDQAYIKPLSDIQAGRKNYFFLPTLFGEGTFILKDLAEEISYKYHQEINIYGLSDCAAYDSDSLPDIPQKSAERFVKAIKSVQKQGPYYLVGYSFGATYALWINDLLEKQGERVESIQMIDAAPPLLLQSLSNMDYRLLLELLINSVITILNGDIFKEQLCTVKLTNYENYPSKKQASAAFKKLADRVKNPLSKSMLALIRRNLKFAHESPAPEASDTWAVAYFVDNKDSYTSKINALNLRKDSPDYLSCFWNRYFNEVTLGGLKVKASHLELLKPARELAVDKSPGEFWYKTHDIMYHMTLDPWGPLASYSVSPVDENKHLLTFLHLNCHELRGIKNYLEKIGIQELDFFPCYQRVFFRHKRDDKLFQQKFTLLALFDDSQREMIDVFLEKSKIKKSALSMSSLPERFMTKSKKACHFTVELRLAVDSILLMTLLFHCYGNRREIIKPLIHGEFKELDHYNINFFHTCFEEWDYDAIMHEVTPLIGPAIRTLLPAVMNDTEQVFLQKNMRKNNNGCYHLRNFQIIQDAKNLSELFKKL